MFRYAAQKSIGLGVQKKALLDAALAVVGYDPLSHLHDMFVVFVWCRAGYLSLRQRNVERCAELSVMYRCLISGAKVRRKNDICKLTGCFFFVLSSFSFLFSHLYITIVSLGTFDITLRLACTRIRAVHTGNTTTGYVRLRY